MTQTPLTHDEIAQRADAFTRYGFNNDTPVEDLRDLQARFDAQHQPIGPADPDLAPWILPGFMIAALLGYVGLALALDAWLFS